MRRAILLFLLWAVPSAFGQSNYAAVTGAVTDPQHSPIAGAAVVLSAKETHAGRRVSTNTQGIAMAPWMLHLWSDGLLEVSRSKQFWGSLGEPNRAFLEALPSTIPVFVTLAFSLVP